MENKLYTEDIGSFERAPNFHAMQAVGVYYIQSPLLVAGMDDSE